ncbi:MAG TPA: hypothetical protein VHF27_00470 [Acidimicrobiales bacterium]|nr:hypothetical protein [Acidimicrobiales bacterium]
MAFTLAWERLGPIRRAQPTSGTTQGLDVEGARRAGLPSIWINRDNSSWPEALPPLGAETASLDGLEDALRRERPARPR